MAIWRDKPDPSGMDSDDINDPGYGVPRAHDSPAEDPIAHLVATETPSDPSESLQTASDDTNALTVQDQLKAIERRVRSQKRRLVGSVLAIGECLTEAQALLANYKTGYFVRWMREHCGFSKKTGYAYMQSWRAFGHLAPKVSNRIQLTAMTVLARDQTPPKAVKEAVAMADDGKTVTAATARQLIAKYNVDNAASKTKKHPEPLIFDSPGGVVIIRLASPDADPGTLLTAAMRQWRGTARTAAA